jgi:hypothetical protein
VAEQRRGVVERAVENPAEAELVVRDAEGALPLLLAGRGGREREVLDPDESFRAVAEEVGGEHEQLLRGRGDAHAVEETARVEEPGVVEPSRDRVVADAPVQLDVDPASLQPPHEVDVVAERLREPGPELLQRGVPELAERRDGVGERRTRDDEVEVGERPQGRVGVEPVGYGGPLDEDGRRSCLLERRDDVRQLPPQERRAEHRPRVPVGQRSARVAVRPGIVRRDEVTGDVVVERRLGEPRAYGPDGRPAAHDRRQRRHLVGVGKAEPPAAKHAGRTLAVPVLSSRVRFGY